MKKSSAPLEKQCGSVKKAVSAETFVFLALFLGGFTLLGMRMGLTNMLNTMMNTGYELLSDTVFYIMAIAVLAGAIGSLLTEFGVVALINKLLSPLMGVLYGLPGAASVGVVTTYLSDNPAILTLADDPSYRRYFKKYQLPALTNLGTAFGMGLVVTAFMLGTGVSGVGTAVIVGNLGAVVGSIVSTRLMILATRKIYGEEERCDVPKDLEGTDPDHRNVRSGGIGARFLAALMEGGSSGVKMGMEIIPGVLIICTVVLMLTKGPGEGGVYTGAAYEGVAVLPWIGEKLSFVLKPLFGFTSSACVSVPVTALGAAGAAIGLVPGLLQEGLATARDVAVFTSMCMCWSGYLSTHVAMMSGLKCSHLTGKAILSHTVGGVCAGIFANWVFYLISLL